MLLGLRNPSLVLHVRIVDGDSPWHRRHGKGQFTGQLLPFGCTVDYLPPDVTLKAMPKFEPRANTGILMGYHLQPGAAWKGEYLVFPRERFVEYDFEKPRRLTELRPVRTVEVKITDSVPQFMMKPLYDAARRTLSPQTIIKVNDAADDTHDDDDDVHDTANGDEASDAVQPADAPIAEQDDPANGVPSDSSHRTLKPDAMGRMYPTDQYGNRIFAEAA